MPAGRGAHFAARRFADEWNPEHPHWGGDRYGLTDNSELLNYMLNEAWQRKAHVWFAEETHFRFDDTLHMTPHSWPERFQVNTLTGAGGGFGGWQPRTVLNFSNMPKDRPAITMTAARRVSLKGFSIVGAGPSYQSGDLGGTDFYYDSPWLAPGTLHNRYGVYCAIAIDAGVGFDPGGGLGWPTIPYLGQTGGTAGVWIDDVNIDRFAAALVHNIDLGAQQGDMVWCTRCLWGDVMIGIISGQSQARMFFFQNGGIGWCRTVYDGLEYGQRQGASALFESMQVGSCYEIFRHAAGFQPFQMRNVRCESVKSIGFATGGLSSFPIELEGFNCHLMGDDEGSRQPFVLECGGVPVRWTGGGLSADSGTVDAMWLQGGPVILDGVQIVLRDYRKPFVGYDGNYDTPTDLRNCPVLSTTSPLFNLGTALGRHTYGNEVRRQLPRVGAVPAHYGERFIREETRLRRFQPGHPHHVIGLAAPAGVTWHDHTKADAIHVWHIEVAGGVATVRTHGAHGFSVAQNVTLTNADHAQIDGVRTVASVINATHFTFATAAPDGVYGYRFGRITFTHADPAALCVNDVVLWAVKAHALHGILATGVTRAFGPVTHISKLDGSTVTLRLLHSRSYYDETWVADGTGVVVHEWAAATPITGDFAAGNPTAVNVAAVGGAHGLFPGMWVTSPCLPANTRVRIVDGTNVTFSRNATQGGQFPLSWGTLHDMDTPPDIVRGAGTNTVLPEWKPDGKLGDSPFRRWGVSGGRVDAALDVFGGDFPHVQLRRHDAPAGRFAAGDGYAALIDAAGKLRVFMAEGGGTVLRAGDDAGVVSVPIPKAGGFDDVAFGPSVQTGKFLKRMGNVIEGVDEPAGGGGGTGADVDDGDEADGAPTGFITVDDGEES